MALLFPLTDGFLTDARIFGVSVRILTPRAPSTATNASVFTSKHASFTFRSCCRALNECRGEDECSSQCTTVGKWILLSLLYNWTGTCNVSQSFNSNLPWPVMGYIIINHPCQLVQTNCWVEAINRRMAFCSLYISVRPIYRQTQAAAKCGSDQFYFHVERRWLDAARRRRTVIQAQTSAEVDQPDGHCEGS